jgi:class 3 adenylate cyclase
MRIEEQMGELVRTGELRRFLPGPVGDRLVGGQLGAEPALARSRITVLVVDIPGFDDLAERLDPEDLSELANEYLTEVTAAALAHGGVVDHLPGGDLMVLFGVPDGPESVDHAWSGAATAVAMRDQLAELGVRCRQRGLTTDLRLRAGLNTGYATVGVFGSSLLRTYTAIGSVVSVAATLRDRAAPGQILCGATTRGGIADRARMRAREPIPRGTGGPPIEAFELLEIGRASEVGAYSAPELIGRPAWPSAVDPAAESRLFRREGSYWTVAYEGSVVRLKDSKGLRYLAHLLANPGVEVHVLQLVNLDRDGDAAGGIDPATARGLGLSVNGDVEGILDERARSSYRDRLAELREELEEATAHHDVERVASAQAEFDALMAQLAEATGLGGRDRRMPTDVERARVNITKRIRGAIAVVGEHHPALERHLRATVRTGAFCSYTPEPSRQLAWNV